MFYKTENKNNIFKEVISGKFVYILFSCVKQLSPAVVPEWRHVPCFH